MGFSLSLLGTHRTDGWGAAPSPVCHHSPPQHQITLRMTFPVWQQPSAPADVTATSLRSNVRLCAWMDSIQPRYSYENVLSFDNEKDSKKISRITDWWGQNERIKVWFVTSAPALERKVSKTVQSSQFWNLHETQGLCDVNIIFKKCKQ